MAHGLWGSRIPVANFIASRSIFAWVRWRLATLRLKNALKDILRPRKVKLINDENTSLILKYWLKKSFDRLNIGGGPKNLAGFINIDFMSYPQVEREVIGNILDLSFIPPGAISQVHSNHVLEHLSEAMIIRQFQEYHRILKDKGLLTIRCPNALGVAYGFWFEPELEDEREEFVALGFPAGESFGNPKDRWFHKDLFALLHWFYGEVGNVANQHLTIITPSKMQDYLKDNGFRIIKMSKPEAINLVVIAEKI